MTGLDTAAGSPTRDAFEDPNLKTQRAHPHDSTRSRANGASVVALREDFRVADAEPPAALGRLANHVGLLDESLQGVAESTQAETRRRDAFFRRLLALADVMAAALALVIAVYASGQTLRPEALLLAPAVIGMGKLLSLYDRDELLLHKATLDEAPRIFHLATLFAISVWLAESFVVIGTLGKIEFLAIGSVL